MLHHKAAALQCLRSCRTWMSPYRLGHGAAERCSLFSSSTIWRLCQVAHGGGRRQDCHPDVRRAGFPQVGGVSQKLAELRQIRNQLAVWLTLPEGLAEKRRPAAMAYGTARWPMAARHRQVARQILLAHRQFQVLCSHLLVRNQRFVDHFK